MYHRVCTKSSCWKHNEIYTLNIFCVLKLFSKKVMAAQKNGLAGICQLCISLNLRVFYKCVMYRKAHQCQHICSEDNIPLCTLSLVDTVIIA